MKLYIPEIGDTLKLTKDWQFDFIPEYRNMNFLDAVMPGYTYCAIHRDWDFVGRYKGDHILYKTSLYDEYENRGKNYTERIQQMVTDCPMDVIDIADFNVSLPAGTELKVDRIYIRKGNSDYSSLTFYALIPGMKKKIRFFAKLKDVNNIEYEPV